MDISSPLKSEVLRPLLTWLVPGAVLIAPYLLLANDMFAGIDSLAKNYSAIFTVFCFFAALAAGVVLEDLGAAIEGMIWDPLLERETGWQQAVWHEYLMLTHQKEPIAQRYLRTVVMRMKFELSFALALVGSWFGWILFDDARGFLSSNGQILFSAIILSVAAYLLWESARSAGTLSHLRALMVAGIDPPTIRIKNEPTRAAKVFDFSVKIISAISLIGSILAFALVLFFDAGFEPETGFSSIVLWFGLGTALAFQPAERFRGLRRRTALRLALLCALCFTMVVVRLLTSDPSLVNFVGAVSFILGCAYFRFMAWRLAGGDPEPDYPAALDVKKLARDRKQQNIADAF